MPSPPAPKSPRTALRPPDFLLPQADKTAARKRNGGPDVYVSWGDQIYGPSAVADVVSGVRATYFEEDALFWFEGRNEWRPVAELPALFENASEELPRAAQQHSAPPEAVKPAWPGARKRSSSSGERRRRRGNRRAAKPRSAQNGGRLIVIAAVLLAVLLTVGMLLLMSLG